MLKTQLICFLTMLVAKATLTDEYYFVHLYKSLDDAQQYCEYMLGTYLVTPKSDAETNALMGMKEFSHYMYWIGIKQKNSSNSPGDGWYDINTNKSLDYTNWAAYYSPNDGDMIENNQKNCAVMTFMHHWYDVSCDDQYYFICKNPSTSFKGYITPNLKLNFYDAVAYCQNSYGTKLVEPKTPQENNKLVNRIYHNYKFIHLSARNFFWVGIYEIKEGGVNNSISWKYHSDNSSLIFENWGTGEPSEFVGQHQHCCAMYYYGDWYDIKCDNTYHFYCEKPKVNSSTTLNMVTASPTTKKFQHEFFFADQKLSFFKAEQFCNLVFHTNLVAPKSSEENTKLLQFAKSMGIIDNIWIGIYEKFEGYGSKTNWIYVDNNNSVLYDNWDIYEPNEYKSPNHDCVEMDYNGEWIDAACAEVRNFACYSPTSCQQNGKNEVFSECGGCDSYCNKTNSVVCNSSCSVGCFCPAGMARDSQGVCVLESQCDKSAYSNDKYIYVDKLLTFYSANDYCKLNYNSQIVAPRNALENVDFQNFLKNVSFNSETIWVGIYELFNSRNQALDNWHYVGTNDAVSYFNWDKSEPHGDNLNYRDCGAMGISTGLWADFKCTNPRKFACWAKAAEMKVENVSALASNYIYVGLNLTWLDANRHCKKKYGTSIAAPRSDDENVAIRKFVNLNGVIGEPIWVGIYESREGHGSKDTWFYSYDNKPVTFSHWALNQPDTFNFKSQNCVEMTYKAEWSNQYCSLIRRFVCNLKESNKNVGQSEVKVFNKSLLDKYIFVNSDKNFLEAQSYCITKINGSLAAPRTIKENNELLQILANSVYFSKAWIGIYKKGFEKKSNFVYVSDNSSLTINNWASGEPSQYKGRNEDCTLLGKDGFWSDQPCYSYLPFICEKKRTIRKDKDIEIDIAKNDEGNSYIYVNREMTYLQASQYCKSMYGTSVSIPRSKHDSIKMEKYMMEVGNDSSIWTGTSTDVNDTWVDSNGDAIKYFNWDKNKESVNSYLANNNVTSRLCAVIDKYYWSAKSCKETFSFLCDEPSTDFVQMYVFVNQEMNFLQSAQYCTKNYKTGIAVPHDTYENELLRHFADNEGEDTNIWIGIQKLSGSNIWVDASLGLNVNVVLNYTNWEDPDGSSDEIVMDSYECAELLPEYKWRKTSCSNKMKFACFSPYYYEILEINNGTKTKQEDDKKAGSQSASKDNIFLVVVLIVASLVICALVVYLVYCVKIRKKREKEIKKCAKYEQNIIVDDPSVDKDAQNDKKEGDDDELVTEYAKMEKNDAAALVKKSELKVHIANDTINSDDNIEVVANQRE